MVEAYTASWIEICPWPEGKPSGQSRGLYSLVDWNLSSIYCFKASLVEAYTASWIEIVKSSVNPAKSPVEAYTASWIEICGIPLIWGGNIVEAYTASWIEIWLRINYISSSLSRLIQPRGLKSLRPPVPIPFPCRGLYSLVDWNLIDCTTLTMDKSRGLYSLVDWNILQGIWKIVVWSRGLYSLVDWNFLQYNSNNICWRRGLYSLVDWNAITRYELPLSSVEAYTASWIEML